MAALDPPSRPAAVRRLTRAFVTAAGVAVAVTLVVTGPPRPMSFDIRLPLLVLGGGALWTAAAWRRTAGAKRAAIPVATPWLLLTSTVGIGLLTARLLADDPAMSGALLAFGAALCCLALGVCLTGGRHDRAARPDGTDPCATASWRRARGRR